MGGLAAATITAPFAPLLSRYRSIFFAMLTLALSMVLYGVLVKTEALGGSDGFNVAKPTLFGRPIASDDANQALFVVGVVVVGRLGIGTRIWFDFTRGLVTLAVCENELRVEYLGASVRRIIAGEFVFAAILAGHHRVVAVFVAAFVLEMVRSFSNLCFPNTWQLALGVFLLAAIRFLPNGIGSLWTRRRKAPPGGAR